MNIAALSVRLAVALQIDPISPSFDGPGVEAGRRIASQIFGAVLVGGIIAVLLSAGLIIFGHMVEHGRMRKAGIVGVISAAAGTAVAAGAAQIVTWGQAIPIFG